MRILFILSLLVFSNISSAAPFKEFRGIWVITWETYKKDGQFLEGEALKERIREIFDNVEKAGLNAVMWQVRQGAAVYYPSSIEPWGKWLQHKSPGFDPLQFALNEAHKRNIELHAWINTFEARETIVGTAAIDHPEW